MNNANDMRTDRLAGAEAISVKARSIAREKSVVLSECAWDIGEDLQHEHAHRLELITPTMVVRVYFSDRDLTTSANNAYRRGMTEDRLSRAVAQLVSRTPSPTYKGH